MNAAWNGITVGFAGYATKCLPDARIICIENHVCDSINQGDIIKIGYES